MKLNFLFVSILFSMRAMAQTPTSGLVASYPFTGNANDASGNGNHGVVNGATLTTDRFGAANAAYSFNGSSNYIKVSGATGVNNNEYSYSLWVKLAALPGSGGGMNLYEVGTNVNITYGQVFGLDNNYNSVTGWTVGDGNTDNSHTVFSSGAMPITDTWYNLVVTRNSTSTAIYVNGQLAGSTASQSNAYYLNPLDIYIGARAQLFQFWNGVIDDIAIYNRVLTPAEITGIVTSTQASIETGELGVYPNPGQDEFTVSSITPMKDASVTVFNSTGQVVQELNHVNGNTVSLSVSKALSGLYFIEVVENGKISKLKFIKQ